jgi:hypothetical protein
MYGWASTIMQRGGDDAVRAVVIGSMTTAGQVLYTFWGIVMYPATDAPYWKKGSITMIVVVFAFVGWSFVVKWVSWKDRSVLRESCANAIDSLMERLRCWMAERKGMTLQMMQLQSHTRRRKADGNVAFVVVCR